MVAGMRRGTVPGGIGSTTVVMVVAMATLITVVAGCTRWEPGSPVAGEPTGPAPTRASVPPKSLPSMSPRSGVPNPPASSAQLTPNVVEDECLLDGAQFTALSGQETPGGENTVLGSAGQDLGRSCFYLTTGGRRPVGRIDVSATDGPPPAEVVQRLMSRGNHAVFDVASGAVVLDTVGAPGAEMYVATNRYLIQIHLDQAKPDDERWAAAGRAAATRLGA